MKAIHSSKTKNDKIDSHKFATLLKTAMTPQAYVYSAEMHSPLSHVTSRKRRHWQYARPHGNFAFFRSGLNEKIDLYKCQSYLFAAALTSNFR
jgi:Zn-dependent M32 family carboxypeptidase